MKTKPFHLLFHCFELKIDNRMNRIQDNENEAFSPSFWIILRNDRCDSWSVWRTHAQRIIEP